MNRIVVLIICILANISIDAQSGENNDAIGIHISSPLLLFNDCCFQHLKHYEPNLQFGYRFGILSRHTSGGLFFHDFQLAYSKERIGYVKNRKNIIENQFLEYEAFLFTYYFGLRPFEKIPTRIFIGHNIGQIVHNHGDEVEWELFGLNVKIDFSIRLSQLFSVEPVIEYSWTYNKTTSYNHRLVFGTNVIMLL